MANLFDIGSGGSRIRYFVCKSSEEIIMNTLELITADEYLYRILINEGYERIVFLDEDVSAFSYDKFSKISFEKVEEFEKKNRKLSKEEKAELIDNKKSVSNNGLSALKMNNLKKAGTQKKSDTSSDEEPMFGKRKVIWKETQWNAHVRKCLSSKYIKTALVIPISRFFRGEYRERTAMLTRTLIDVARTKNVVIFKLDNEDQFLVNWANDEVVRTMDGDMAIIYGNHVAGKKASISDILKKRLIKVSGLNRSDIANCILRLKYIESDSQKRYFANLNVTQSYLLGKAIFEHVENKKPIVEDNDDTFVSSDVGTRTIFDILKNYADAIVEEYKDKIDDEEWDYTPHSDVSSYGLERIDFRYVKDIIKHAEMSESDIIKEFSKYVGAGMEEVKKQIIDTMLFFKSEKEKCESNKALGVNVSEDDLPYYTMKFVGPPGTGKTVTSEIVAKLMHVNGILPRSKVVKVDATKLVKGHIGETADEIRKVAASALGGVLVIDEFYAFNQAYNGGNIAGDAVNAIMGILNEDRENICIILCGYEDQVNDRTS